MIDTENGPLFYRLVLNRAELRCLLDVGNYQYENYEGQSLLTLDGAARELDLFKPIVLWLVHQGLLSSVNEEDVEAKLLLRRDVVETFRGGYVFSSREAARLLNIFPHNVEYLLSRGVLKPVDSEEQKGKGHRLFFRREEIEALRQKSKRLK